jgi:hypothetical protein
MLNYSIPYAAVAYFEQPANNSEPIEFVRVFRNDDALNDDDKTLSKLNIEEEALFRVASISKSFTA